VIQHLAVIDIGSNTSTLAVYAGTREGGLDRVVQEGAPLRLMRQLGTDGRFPAAAIRDTVEAVRRFKSIAASHGALSVEAVATSAVRDAVNQAELLAAVRAEGVPIQVLDGEREGVCAVVSAVNTLPVQDGFVVDMGGGSLQIAHITTRRAREVVSLPLGALRLTDRFFAGDPPSATAVTALRRHVQAQLSTVRWFGAAAGGTLVGVGGSLRCLAKMDRKARGWPVSSGHGYRLEIDAVEAAWEQTSRLDAAARARLPGLAAHRVETVAAAALVFFVLMRAGGFDELLVSSYGIREGVAFRRLLGEEDPLVPDVRVAGLTGRFPGGAGVLGASRKLAAVWGLDPAVLLAAAWTLPDAGEAVRQLLGAPLPGFTQPEVLAAVDVLAGGAHVLDARARERLRVAAEVAVADPALSERGGRVRASLPPALRRRVAAAYGDVIDERS